MRLTAPAADAAIPGLVGTAVRLRWALLRGAVRAGPGSTPRRVGLILGAAAGAGLSLAAFTSLSISRDAGRLPEDLATLIYTALLIGWTILPILTFASDDLLDPTKLSLLPLGRRQLMTVLGVGGLVGVAPVATAIAALGLLPATVDDAGSLFLAFSAAVVEVVTCVAASRATASGLSSLLRSRRGRDLGAGAAALVAVSFQLVNPFAQAFARHHKGSGTNLLKGITAPLRWTPPGLLATASSRSFGIGLLCLLEGVVFLALIVWGWERAVRRTLETPDASSSNRRRGTTLVPRPLRQLLPAGRVGAIAAKDLRYLTREPRRMIALVVSFLLPIVFVALAPISFGQRPPSGVVFGVAGVALLFGLSGANRFGMDGTSTWVLISSATDPRDARRDLLGGDVAALITGSLLVLAEALTVTAFTGSARHLLAALGLAFGLLATIVGTSGWIAVLVPYSVPESRNAFSTGNAGQGCAAGLVTLLALLGCTALCAPVIALAITSLFITWVGIVLLVVGPLYGLAVGAVMRRMAVRRWAAKAPEILQILAEARP